MLFLRRKCCIIYAFDTTRVGFEHQFGLCAINECKGGLTEQNLKLFFQGKRGAKQLQQAPAQGHSYEVGLIKHYIISLKYSGHSRLDMAASLQAKKPTNYPVHLR